MLDLNDITSADQDDAPSSSERERALDALRGIEISEELAAAIKADKNIAVDAANAAYRLGMFKGR